MPKTEFDFIVSSGQLGKYAGKWIAVVDHIVFPGDSAKEVFERARREHPEKVPLVMKVPRETVMLL